ncbi:hypothetical protein [Flavobacterium subsaxonicum]|uniref:Uncharacterized protein n=1 Tax=Flavobacterium subsaxonicum WB 4.1-42 = DSM 21790 TaxID=1121898 RepID=A0A0A2MS59_9FLAO|nr:hypothetical protein [Flavobacterium subsaxonicum]KGO91085.1 hypothetical protein Q766_19985 [Flavobacterium subsaxonicum WB 4.1-42 = DSM 21790]
MKNIKVLIALTFALLSILNSSEEKKFLKFVSGNKHVILFAKDVIEIDTLYSVLTITNEAAKKIGGLDVANLQVSILEPDKNKWLKVDVFDVRSSAERHNPMIVTNKNKLLFYSDNQIVIAGNLWFTIAEKLHIKQKTEQIYGSWGMCKTQVDEDTFIVANVCKTVVFNDNGGGKLLMGDNILSNFKWKIDPEKLQFTFNTPTDREGFLDTATEYSFKLYTKGDFKYLEIKPRDKETIYYLSRLKSGK